MDGTAWQARFKFHGELDELLPAEKMDCQVRLPPSADQSVKHLIESLGVPHTEVGRILVNGSAVDFGYLVRPGDEIAVYPLPAGAGTDGGGGTPRFILDNHLGRLAAYLRMLGYDSLYRNDIQDDELALRCNQENRILLTRDKHLLMRNLVERGYWLRSKVPRLQLEEVILRFGLTGAQPFQRCLRCNEPLQPRRKEEVIERLEPLTRRYFDEFHFCPACQQVYWKGSHYERMSRMIAQVLRKP